MAKTKKQHPEDSVEAKWIREVEKCYMRWHCLPGFSSDRPQLIRYLACALRDAFKAGEEGLFFPVPEGPDDEQEHAPVVVRRTRPIATVVERKAPVRVVRRRT